MEGGREREREGERDMDRERESGPAKKNVGNLNFLPTLVSLIF